MTSSLFVMGKIAQLCCFSILTLVFTPVSAHQATATYVGNEAVLVVNGDKKVLFDPFFHQAFGTYQLVPKEIRRAIFAGHAPYDNLTAIVISHAHGDHFSANDVLRYLGAYPSTQLIAPKQAIDELIKLPKSLDIRPQIRGIELAINDAPVTINVAGLMVEAVRIPHAGWPSRANIENLVFRVTLNHAKSPITIMHLGDADPDDNHYIPYKRYWQQRVTDTAFPPYWFYFSAEGNDILNEILNVKNSVGLHVPVIIPKRLKATGADFFSSPGEVRTLSNKHSH
ncbi:MAG: MBL fold metallo-hydrolase [Paraglaciecola sp.]|uniref:MBL fold metallo-hydrolase n=1 Tax=Paraglaciecola sp. TaxID=1920173 RepID=UPI00329979FA